MALICYKFKYVIQEDDRTVREAVVEFRTAELVPDTSEGAKAGDMRLDRRATVEPTTLRARESRGEAAGKCMKFTAKDFGQLRSIDELRTWLNDNVLAELAKDYAGTDPAQRKSVVRER